MGDGPKWKVVLIGSLDYHGLQDNYNSLQAVWLSSERSPGHIRDDNERSAYKSRGMSEPASCIVALSRRVDKWTLVIDILQW